MKKFLLVMLAAMLCVSMFAVVANAEGEKKINVEALSAIRLVSWL